jgi:intraflagellar transport protein 88
MDFQTPPLAGIPSYGGLDGQYDFGHVQQNGDGGQYDFGHVQQKPPPSSYMKRVAQERAETAFLAGAPGVPGTAAAQVPGTSYDARPMTSVKGAGYQAPRPDTFDPFPQKDTSKSALQKKPELTPEEKCRELEREIHALVEESAFCREQGKQSEALDKAKEAGQRERALCRQRETLGSLEQLNVDLTYAVHLNLADQQTANNNEDEAYKIYTQIVKNKQYPNVGRFRVNMGNICFRQQKYPTAIKMYRMALDQIPANMESIRCKITRNIGHAFFAMRQFPDAADSYENLLVQDGQHLDFMTAFNLILCYYALGDCDRMKQGFQRMLAVQQVGLEDPEDELEDLVLGSPKNGGKNMLDELAIDGDRRLVEGEDGLKEDIKRRQREAARYILNAAQLIAPLVEKTAIAGFDWVIGALEKNGFPGIGSEIEISKASYFLRRKEFDKALEILKNFERKEASLMARASTNLAFLSFLEGDYEQSDRYADIAVKADRYNARALVNKGNCLFMSRNLERAKEVYLEAIGVTADCLEAIYNLGIVNIHMGNIGEAMLAFDKLNSITNHNCEVMWQLGDICEKTGDFQKAHHWFSLVVSPQGRPTDPGTLARIAGLYANQDDETQAYHYHLEAYRYWPVDLNVITWLGIYYVKQELYEQAIPYFARAAEIDHRDSKWPLMVASCYRRLGNINQAMSLYERVHKTFPEDQECLQYLILISKDLGMSHERYDMALRKLQRLEEAKAAQANQQEQDFGARREDDAIAQFRSPDALGEQPVAYGAISEDDSKENIVYEKPKKMMLVKKENVDTDDMDWGDTSDLLLP